MYYNHKGKYEKQANELEKLVPPSGPAKTQKGELMRAATKIYHDYHNNGFGNDWSEAAGFLMDNIKLDYPVQRMMLRCGKGNMSDQYEDEVEHMMDQTIEQIYGMGNEPRKSDMWDWDVNHYDFADIETDYDDDDYEDYDEDEDLRESEFSRLLKLSGLTEMDNKEKDDFKRNYASASGTGKAEKLPAKGQKALKKLAKHGYKQRDK